MSRCVILSAGPVSDVEALRSLLLPDDVYIAADGGYRLAQALGVPLMAVVADFDSSIKPKLPDEVEVVCLPVRKDCTDTAAAVAYARDKDFTDFLLLGCIGGRLDHQYAAMQLLVQLSRSGCRAEMADADNCITAVISSPCHVQPMCNWSMSLFAFGGVVRGLTIRGAAYELENYDLQPDNALCVSNAVDAGACEITFEDGVLLLFRAKD
jgi:thiamine pyrophosphokinase